MTDGNPAGAKSKAIRAVAVGVDRPSVRIALTARCRKYCWTTRNGKVEGAGSSERARRLRSAPVQGVVRSGSQPRRGGDRGEGAVRSVRWWKVNPKKTRIRLFVQRTFRKQAFKYACTENRYRTNGSLIRRYIHGGASCREVKSDGLGRMINDQNNGPAGQGGGILPWQLHLYPFGRQMNGEAIT